MTIFSEIASKVEFYFSLQYIMHSMLAIRKFVFVGCIAIKADVTEPKGEWGVKQGYTPKNTEASTSMVTEDV